MSSVKRLKNSRAASRVRVHAFAMAAILVTAISPLFAQGRGGPGGPGGGGGGMGGGMSHSPFGNTPSLPNPNTRTSPPPGAQPNASSPADSTMRGGLQLGPPGRWWDDQSVAKSIGLDSAQQHRMDDVFSANRGNLLKLYKNLQHEESQLGKVVHARELDEKQIFDQIDRIVQARGDLEKANAHMLLQIRKEMTPEQTARLDDHKPTP